LSCRSPNSDPLLLLFPGSSKHSLSYSYLHVSGLSQEPPQFLSMVHLDDQTIARYDNHTRTLEPLVPWMEMVKVKTFLDPDWVFRADLKSPQNAHPQNEGEQADSSLQPREAERVRQAESQEDIPALKSFCFLVFAEPPVGKVNSKMVDDSLEVLTCQAFGFYPKEIQATWMRDREICKYETLHRNVAPNSDGTYYVQLSIEIDPNEKDHYWCHVMHNGLQEPLVLAWKEEPDEKLQHPGR
ncbi:HLA class I histocompatibility antigen, alpha chain F, partial [Ophiophagus hannah]